MLSRFIQLSLLVIAPLFCRAQANSQDTLIGKEALKDSKKIRIDIDFVPLISFSTAGSFQIVKHHFLGLRAGAGWTVAFPLKNYINNETNVLLEILKLDIFYTYVRNSHLEFNTGIRESILLFSAKNVDEHRGFGLGVGLYFQPMIGWRHFKFGTLIFANINQEIRPIYLYPFCARGTISF